MNTEADDSVYLGGNRVFASAERFMTTVNPDIALLQQFRQTRDEHIFAQIVQDYMGMVFRTSLRVVGDKSKAEDIAQETFFQLLRKCETVEQSLAGWLHRTATRLAIDMLRSDQARARRERTYYDEQQAQVDTWQELSPYIDEALNRLDPEDSELLIQHFLQNHTQTDLADNLGVSRPTVHRRVNTALGKLREELKQMGVVAGLAVIMAVFERSSLAAVPATLAAELGKMSMVSGVSSLSNSAAAGTEAGLTGAGLGAGTATGGSLLSVVPLVAGGLFALGVITAGVMMFVHFIQQEPTEQAARETHTYVASTSTDSKGTHASASVSISGSGQATATATTSSTTSVSISSSSSPRDHNRNNTPSSQMSVYAIHSRSDQLSSGHIIFFQNPSTSRNATIALVFADNHVRQLPMDKARILIENQIGMSMENFMAANTPVLIEP